MTPFEEFRLWLRQGAPAERVMAAVAAIAALVLVMWAVVPPGRPSSGQVSTASGLGAGASQGGGLAGSGPSAASGGAASAGAQSSSGGATSAGAAANSAGSSSSGAGAASGPGTGAPAAATRSGPAQAGGTGGANCGSLTSTDQGVTASTVHVGVMIIDVAGANSQIGVPTPAQMKAENQAFVDYINSHGGIACRKVVPTYYTDNPVDANGEHSLCVQIVSDKLFAVIGNLYSTANATCLVEHQIPAYGQTGLPTSEFKQFYPYFYSFYMDSEHALRDYVLGAKQEGWFAGMKKLGLVEQDCFPEYTQQTLAPLASIGIDKSQISVFDIGCPTGVVDPTDRLVSAVLQFERDGVTHVMTAGHGMAQFSIVAKNQNFHPKYATSDVDMTIGITGGSTTTPDPSNFDGAMAITGSQYGARQAGLPDNPGTVLCDAIMKAGNAPLSHDGDGYAGGVCDQWTLMYQGALHAPSLTRTNLAVGLDSIGHYDLSFPGGPTLWNQPGETWASNYWRASAYVGSCSCWKVTDATYHASF